MTVVIEPITSTIIKLTTIFSQPGTDGILRVIIIRSRKPGARIKPIMSFENKMTLTKTNTTL